MFTVRGRLNQPQHPVGQVMSRVMAEWLPSSGYELAMPCELETYGPGNTNDDEYTCELWVPVRKTK